MADTVQGVILTEYLKATRRVKAFPGSTLQFNHATMPRKNQSEQKFGCRLLRSKRASEEAFEKGFEEVISSVLRRVYEVYYQLNTGKINAPDTSLMAVYRNYYTRRNQHG